LVDYEAVLIKSKVRINGVFLKEGERVGKIDTETGEELFDDVEDERTFSAEEVEREITSPDSNRKIIEEVAKHAYAHEAQTDRFPKILIFAVNDIPHASHADQLVRICREVFNQGDDFVQKITGNPNVESETQDSRSDEPIVGRTIIGGAEIPIQRFASMPPNIHATGDIESMSLLAGQSVGLIDEIRPAAEILRETINGAERLIRELSAKVHENGRA